MTESDGDLIERAARRIVAQFHPQRIVLFGSRARGESRPESDVDLFVEIETRDRRATAARINRLVGRREGRVLYDRRETIPVSPGTPPHPPYRAWLQKAERDLRVVQRCLAAPPIPWDAVCFHSRQSAEKVLKGLLVYYGQQPRKTHKREDVLVECVRFAPSLKKLHAACVRLTPYGVDPRYPELGPGPRAREGRAVRAMERIRASVLPLLP